MTEELDLRQRLLGRPGVFARCFRPRLLRPPGFCRAVFFGLYFLGVRLFQRILNKVYFLSDKEMPVQLVFAFYAGKYVV